MTDNLASLEEAMRQRGIPVDSIQITGASILQRLEILRALNVVFTALTEYQECRDLLQISSPEAVGAYMGNIRINNTGIAHPDAIASVPNPGADLLDTVRSPANNPISLYNKFFDISTGAVGRATTIIHELWHIAGGGAAVDRDILDRNETVMSSCRTGQVFTPRR